MHWAHLVFADKNTALIFEIIGFLGIFYGLFLEDETIFAKGVRDF